MSTVSRLGLTATFLAFAGASATAAAQEPDPPPEAPAAGPLAGFDRLIGTWEAGSTRQTFEWGVGGLVVRARSTIVDEGGSALVSEGMFLHDPLRDEVRGYFAAVDMPVAYFEYTARWQGDTLVAHLTTTDAEGRPRRYVERCEVRGDDRIAWTLREGTDAGAAPTMRAEFRRVPDAPAADPSEGGEDADSAGIDDPPVLGEPTRTGRR
jgi:hypothetical protein